MGGCCAFKCTNSTTKGHRMLRVPWNAERQKQWAIAINRLGKDGKFWMPSLNSRLCSELFISGSSSDDPANVDYVPSIFRPSQKLSEKCDKAIESHKRRCRVAEKRSTAAAAAPEPTALEQQVPAEDGTEVDMDVG
ncbi:uncharacterized protein LOC135384340 [Ornithodoros turicata]|uniref:uncharacterized protein LOC135384340 n=1 Tax=Ornithodoros turicata TaxID=34597 RepID=UPI0031395693